MPGTPRPVAGERDGLLTFLAHQRSLLRIAAHGLTDEQAARTEEVIAGFDDLGRPVPVPKGVPWFPAEIEAWSVRWVLLHLIEEVARHAGHADIVRESLDGATAIPLMAAVEGWPETPWVTPWRARATV